LFADVPIDRLPISGVAFIEVLVWDETLALALVLV
jgi:hypothetical protein